MAIPSSTPANLQSEWHTLNDLDRGRAVLAIHLAGISLREVAREVKSADSLLRHLLQAIKAPAEDQRLARLGELSINELVRRAKTAGVLSEAKQNEARQLKGTRDAVKGSKIICGWMVQEKLSGPFCESIIREAQRQLVIAEQANHLPKDAAPVGMPVAEIITSCKPPPLNTDEIHEAAWFAYWLARWTYRALTDSDVRYQALELALTAQFKR